jgi:hypothetical protein
MRAETAAGYCDEPSVDAFLAKVQRVSTLHLPEKRAACRNGIEASLIAILLGAMVLNSAL